MNATVEVLTGIAGTGKTTRLVAGYRAALRDARAAGRPGSTLWIAPTHRARRAVLSRLPGDDLRACFAPNVFTFEGFAEQILKSSDRPVAPLFPVARRRLLRNIVDDLVAAERLPHFASIARTSGFLDVLIQFVSELKREEIWPEQFAAACRARGELPKDRELGLIYGRYQQRLLELGLYDTEGRFWSARDALDRGCRGPFADLALVVVDGFTDFTFTQFEILRHLSRMSERLMISLPLESPLVRDDLFAKTDAARERIVRTLGAECDVRVRNQRSEIRGQKSEGSLGVPSFDRSAAELDSSRPFHHIAEQLFANPRNVPRLPRADAIEVLAATGQLGEVEAIAERVKHLLLAGVKPGEIVVAVRSLDDYRDLIEEVFAACGIPFWCDAGTPLSRAPLLKALFAVIQLELEDWPYERLTGVLDSTYFRPAWKACRNGQAVRDVGDCLRRLKLHAQRSAILKSLERYIAALSVNEAAPPHTKREPGGVGAPEDSGPPPAPPYEGGEQDGARHGERDRRDARLRSAEIAFALLERLSSATEPLRRPAEFADWVDRIVSLAGELGIAPNRGQTPPLTKGGPGGIATPADSVPSPAPLYDGGGQANGEAALHERDLRVWDLFRRIMYDAVRAEKYLQTKPRKMPLDEFAVALDDLLHTERIAPAGSEQGRVQIFEAEHVRNLDVPHLLLAGLTETSFPRSRSDDCLYGESERHRLNRHGLTLGHRTSRSQDEMLLFYGIVTRARNTLVLSYPAVSAAGQPLFPSPYLTALNDLYDPRAIEVTQVGRLDPVPPADRMLTRADLRVVAVAEARQKRPGLFRALCESPETSHAALNVLAAVEAIVHRFQTRGWTMYDGSLQSAESRKRLNARYSRDYQFSATELESYAGCAFRFFLSDVLKAAPLEPPGIATDYRERGVLVHNLLASLHREAAGDETLGATGQEIAARFRQLVDERLGERVVDSRLQEALNTIEQQLLHEWAEAYGGQCAKYVESLDENWEAPPSPAHLEVPFGAAREHDDDAKQTVYESLVFGSGENETHICGRIDRIDVGRIDRRPVFTIIDYKTGRPPRFSLEDVASGRAIQLALYTLAVQRLGVAGPEARPFQMGYWSLRETGFAPGLKTRAKKLEAIDEAVLDSLETILDELVPRLAAGIRSGYFAVNSGDTNCTGRCSYSTVCRINQIRPLQDSLAKWPGLPDPQAAR